MDGVEGVCPRVGQSRLKTKNSLFLMCAFLGRSFDHPPAASLDPGYQIRPNTTCLSCLGQKLIRLPSNSIFKPWISCGTRVPSKTKKTRPNMTAITFLVQKVPVATLPFPSIDPGYHAAPECLPRPIK